MSQASVEIYTNLLLNRDSLISGLQETNTDVQGWAQQINSTPVALNFSADLSTVSAAIAAFRDVQESTPIRIPVVLDMQGGMDEIGAIRGGASMGGIADGVAAATANAIARAYRGYGINELSGAGEFDIANQSAPDSGRAFHPAEPEPIGSGRMAMDVAQAASGYGINDFSGGGAYAMSELIVGSGSAYGSAYNAVAADAAMMNQGNYGASVSGMDANLMSQGNYGGPVLGPMNNPFIRGWGPGAEYTQAMLEAQFGPPADDREPYNDAFVNASAGEEGGGFLQGSLGIRGLHAAVFAGYAIDRVVSEEQKNEAEERRNIGGTGRDIEVERKLVEENRPWYKQAGILLDESNYFAQNANELFSSAGRQKLWRGLQPLEQMRDPDQQTAELDEAERQEKVTNEQKKRTDTIIRNTKSFNQEAKKEDREVSELGMAPADKLQATVDDTLKDAREAADRMENEWQVWGTVFKDVTSKAEEGYQRAVKIHDAASAELADERFSANNQFATRTRAEQDILSGNPEAARIEGTKERVQKEYEEIRRSRGNAAASDWLQNIGQPQIDRATQQSELGQQRADETSSRAVADIEGESAGRYLKSLGPQWDYAVGRGALIRHQEDEIAVADAEAKALEGVDSAGAARARDRVSALKATAPSDVAAYDRSYQISETEKYEHMKVEGEQALLRGAGKGAEAEVLGLRENIARRYREAGDDPDKQAAVRAYASAMISGERAALLHEDSQFGLSGQGMQSYFQNEITRGANLEGAMKALNRLQSNVNQSDIPGFGGVSGTDPGFGDDLKGGAAALIAAANALKDIKPIYVVEN